MSIEQWATIISGGAAAIALIFNSFTFWKQKRSTDAALLANITDRFFELEEKRKEYGEEKKNQYDFLYLNFLEWFSYLVNMKYIPFRMAEIYQNTITYKYEYWSKNKENIQTVMVKNLPEEFSELKRLYKRFNK